MSELEQEFQTVDLVLCSDAQTRGVDAFTLTVIKAERQIRKLFTHLVYQFPCFLDVQGANRLLREALCAQRVYFEGFENGIDALAPHTVAQLVGTDYPRLQGRLEDARDFRNKIFHGQLTVQSLQTEDLVRLVKDIRSWCSALSAGAVEHIGYDGFERPSMRRSKREGLVSTYKVQFVGIESYSEFIKQHMTRR